MGLFLSVRLRKWVGGVSVWALACAGLEFCGIICGCVVAEMGWLGWRLGVFFLCTIRFCGGCVWTCNKEIRWEG